MVQRKVVKKLEIIIPASSNHRVDKPENQKPFFYHQQEVKSPGLKKKMKKSRSFKGSDVENKKSSLVKKNISLPGEPPPLKSKSSPNYMKSTSSSEHKQVNSSPKNRSLKSLSRNSSLKKLSWNLTKSPSFKKSSRLVIYGGSDMKSEKPTCSSTLKSVKFPTLLELSPGGTEAEGTSAMKVCSYTYCSLNGHHHPLLPPLKSFMSAKRRTLKVQKSFKLGALSPRKAKVSGKHESKEIDSNESGKDFFFVEIYAKSEDAESVSDGSPKSEIDFEEYIEKCSDFIPNEMEICSEEQRILEDSLSVSAQEESDNEEDRASVEEGDNFSETTDMEWEEGQFFDRGASNSIEDVNEKIIKDRDLCIDYVMITDEYICIDNENIFADGVLQEVREEESACSDAPNESDYETDGQNSSAEDDQEFATGDDKEEEIESIIHESENETIDAVQDISIQYDNSGMQLQSDIYDSNQTDENEKDLETETIENGAGDEPQPAETEDDIPSDDQDGRVNEVVEQNIPEKDEDHSNKRKIPSFMDSEEQRSPKSRKLDDNNINEAATTEGAKPDSQIKYLYARGSNDKKTQESPKTLKWKIERGRFLAEGNEDSWKFNPAEPNYLPLTPEPDTEKVDLKHQITDDRKNSEEWMLDYALQQAVSKLAPVKKKKVAMLVAAFETVLPVSKFDSSTHLRRSPSFTHCRPIQACS
jgi:hypothetical protein